MNNTIKKIKNDFVVMPLEYNVKFSAICDQTKVIQERLVELSNAASKLGDIFGIVNETMMIAIEINKLRYIASQPIMPNRYKSGRAACINYGNKRETIIGRGGKIYKI